LTQDSDHQESTLRTVTRVAVNTCVLFVVLGSSAILEFVKRLVGTGKPMFENSIPNVRDESSRRFPENTSTGAHNDRSGHLGKDDEKLSSRKAHTEES
jgi:hypothetical protein